MGGRVLSTMAKAEVSRLIYERGSITPDEVVEEARPVSSPMHRWFEWDDTRAAVEYRRGQAAQLIRVAAREPVVPTVEPRVFVRVAEATYEPAVTAMEDPEKRLFVLNAADSEFRAALHKRVSLLRLHGSESEWLAFADLVDKAKAELGV